MTSIESYAYQQPAQNVATVLCCNCGTPMAGTGLQEVAMCPDCIRLTVDVTEGIQKEGILHFCRNCERFLQPPSQWLVAAPESREMMALCLRKLRGLQKSDRRLIDCSFIWTEPHSKRIKLKITVQQEAFAKAIVQQTFEVEFVVQNHQCPDCAKSYTPNTWRAVVQIRQKVPHKRTFFYLEQVILKHHAHLDTVSIKEAKDGLDFYYSTRANAVKMVDFLSSVVPARSKRSEELISQDVHTSVSSYKFTYSVEIVPMCREDLVCLPLKVAQQLGHIARFTLCCRVANTLRLIDPQTLQTADLPAAVYWRTPFPSLAHVGELVEFIVLDIEPVGQESGKYVLADAEVARSSDLGQNDTTFFVKTHLGAVLSAGDAVMGYHLFNSNFNHEIFETINPSNVPEVVLVKKSYPNRKKPNGRQWKLQRMAKEHNEPVVRKQEQDKLEQDYELFLRELEEDSEIRQADGPTRARLPNPTRMEGVDGEEQSEDHVESDEDEDDDGSLPGIDVGELRDELEDMQIEKGDSGL